MTDRAPRAAWIGIWLLAAAQSVAAQVALPPQDAAPADQFVPADVDAASTATAQAPAGLAGAADAPATSAPAAPSPGKADAALALRSIPQLPHGNGQSPYATSLPLTHLAGDSITDEVELRLHRDGWNLVWTGLGTIQQDATPSSAGVLDEAVLDADWAGLRWSIGKKVLSWDVGFGFRPLDIVQQENRRALLVYALEGIPGISAEAFGATSAWTFVLANPGRGEAGQSRDDGSAALRYYRRIDGVDGYAAARLSRRDEAQAGASFTWVASDEIEWHASALYQQRYELSINRLAAAPGAPPLAAGDPMATVARRQAARALVGTTWTNEDGWSLLAEAWHDGTTYTSADWRALRALDARQLALLGAPGVPPGAVPGNLAYSNSYYLPPNLLRDNLLVHLSRKIDSLTPAFDLLGTPADGGLVATASAAYEGDKFRLDAGLRWFTGRADSAYRELAANRIYYLGASWFL
jgi:hypothetical protein